MLLLTVAQLALPQVSFFRLPRHLVFHVQLCHSLPLTVAQLLRPPFFHDKFSSILLAYVRLLALLLPQVVFAQLLPLRVAFARLLPQVVYAQLLTHVANAQLLPQVACALPLPLKVAFDLLPLKLLKAAVELQQLPLQLFFHIQLVSRLQLGHVQPLIPQVAIAQLPLMLFEAGVELQQLLPQLFFHAQLVPTLQFERVQLLLVQQQLWLSLPIRADRVLLRL